MPSYRNAVFVKSAVLEAFAVTVCVAGCGAGRGLQPSADGGTRVFAATGSMTTPREGHTATLLPGGKVLITGGVGASPLASAELYDPNVGRFAATGSLTVPRTGHTATLLQNGEVLIVGGYSSNPGWGEPVAIASVELYDPETGTFATTGSMGAARSGHVATLLPDGKVLVAGGLGGPAFSSLQSAEIFDPSVGTFMPTGSMVSFDAAIAQLLPNGMVLIDGSSAAADAALFDEVAGVFTLTGNMTTDRGGGYSATLLQTGDILVAGGDSTGKTAEIYVPVTGTFAATGSMSASMSGPTGTLLPNGMVLVAGGSKSACCPSVCTSSAELYDAGTGAFSPTASMTAPRCYHTATLLPNGMVLVAGGQPASSSGNSVASAELYE